jgi:hypothetical protein
MKSKHRLIVGVYVDDLIIMGECDRTISEMRGLSPKIISGNPR